MLFCRWFRIYKINQSTTSSDIWVIFIRRNWVIFELQCRIKQIELSHWTVILVYNSGVWRINTHVNQLITSPTISSAILDQNNQEISTFRTHNSYKGTLINWNLLSFHIVRRRNLFKLNTSHQVFQVISNRQRKNL